MSKETENYIGIWENEVGNRLLIEKEKGKILVSFFANKEKPVERSFARGAPSLKMPATYNESEYMLEVELWGKGKAYNLCLWHAPAYELDPDHQEALIPGLSKSETDTFLNQYDNLFGALKHYRRVTKKNHGEKRELPCLR
jgi:hypothetical protein